MSRSVLIASGKGGTGKTFFAANAGALLAMKGHKTVILDMDMGLRDLDLYMGLESKVIYNIMDVLSGICKIKQALIKDKRFSDLYIMAAATANDKRDVTPLHAKILCEKLKERFDYIIIDAPAGIGEGLELAAAGADMAVVITEPEVASVRDADALDRALKDLGISETCCVVNKVNGELITSGAVPGISSISKGLRMEIAGMIQRDDNINISTNKGEPIVIKKGTYIEKNMAKIIERILE